MPAMDLRKEPNMSHTPPMGTLQKALDLNLDNTSYGTIAEIGAGQEVARCFFRAGGAAGTMAKSMSAYDMKVSDSIYGGGGRYVSRDRLEKMLDHEFQLLMERLTQHKSANTQFFAFADTVAARSFKTTGECHGWMGISLQLYPQSEPSTLIIHVRMLEQSAEAQQDALGILGVNLIYGAYNHWKHPQQLLASLKDNLVRPALPCSFWRAVTVRDARVRLPNPEGAAEWNPLP